MQRVPARAHSQGEPEKESGAELVRATWHCPTGDAAVRQFEFAIAELRSPTTFSSTDFGTAS